MRTIYLFVFLLLPISIYGKKSGDFERHYYSKLNNLSFPIVIIETVNGEIPKCDTIHHPEGMIGDGITNATKVPCRIRIVKQGDVLYDSGEYKKGAGGGKIKINGNSSAYRDNYPYKIKLEKKADLLFRGSSYEDKEWRLVKDAVSLKTMIGLKINELMGLSWTPAYEICNVFLNDDYQGCYFLIESVKKGGSRLDVSDSGYIVERDAYWWNEEKYFGTNYLNRGRYYRWTWKYPDDDDVSEDELKYIQDYINQAEISIETGTYINYLDVESFAAWVLGHDILGTWDCGGSNIFVMKYDKTPNTKLTMCNMWDFDSFYDESWFIFRDT